MPPADRARQAALRESLNAIEAKRIELADHRAVLDELVADMKQHIDAAAKHAAALDGDVTGARAGRRQRLNEIAEKGNKIAQSDAAWAAREAQLYKFPAVPKAWAKCNDPDRQVAAVVADETVTSNNHQIDLNAFDSSGFERHGGPVLLNHEGRVVARCFRVERDGSALIAHIQFAPAHVSCLADDVFRDVASGELRSASVGWIRRHHW